MTPKIQKIIDDVKWYARTYNTTINVAIDDYDYPLTSAERDAVCVALNVINNGNNHSDLFVEQERHNFDLDSFYS